VRIKIADILSIVLGPQAWMPLLYILFFLYGNFRISYTQYLIPILFTLQVGLPLLGPYVAHKLNLVTDWDLPIRRERILFLIITIISWIVSLFLIYVFGNNPLFKVSLIVFILIILLSVITLFWKISFHAAINTAGVIFINYLFDNQLLYLWLLIPLVCWARLTLKRHTFSQLFAGVMVVAILLIAYLDFYM
jgi:hypothetical protein